MTAATWDPGPLHTSPGRPWPQEEGREGPLELSPRRRGLAGEANTVVILSTDSGFKSAHYLPAVWCRAQYFIPMCLCFPICKTGTTVI